MRNISFALTEAQILDGSKLVTRRLGWLHAKPGHLLRPVRKCMGLRPGEKISPIRGPIAIIDVRREPLSDLITFAAYGLEECRLEGFPGMSPGDFVSFFCKSHRGCTPETIVTRIAFGYT